MVESESLSISSYFLHFPILCPFPHSFSISSSSFSHFLSISSPFPLHFLIISPFPRSPAARLQRFVQPWVYKYIYHGFHLSL